MPKTELYGSPHCPHTEELRGWLDWNRRDFVEYDVESDAAARARMQSLTGQRTVPVLVEDGKVVEIGWHGRGCVV